MVLQGYSIAPSINFKSKEQMESKWTEILPGPHIKPRVDLIYLTVFSGTHHLSMLTYSNTKKLSKARKKIQLEFTKPMLAWLKKKDGLVTIGSSSNIYCRRSKKRVIMSYSLWLSRSIPIMAALGIMSQVFLQSLLGQETPTILSS